MRQLLHLPEQRLFSLGILRLLPFILLSIDDRKALRVKLLGVNPSQLLNRLVALLLETLCDFGPGALVLERGQRVEKNIFAV